MNPGALWSGNVKAAIASLRRSKTRSFFTMLGVIIGVCSVVTIVSLGVGLKNQVSGQVQKLGSNVLTIRSGQLVDRSAAGAIRGVNLLAFFNTSTLNDNDIRSLNRLSSVRSVIPIDFVTSSARGDSGRSDDLVVIGTTAELAEALNLQLDYGSFFANDSGLNQAVIGTAASQRLFKTRNAFAHTVSVGGSNFVVRGVLTASSGGLLSFGQTDFNSAIFIPYPAAYKLTNGQVNLSQILVAAKPGVDLDTAINDIRRVLTRNHRGGQDFTILKQKELLDVSNRVVDNLTGFISSIAAISLLVGGIGIMDIMLVAVTERTREIGIRKAIGATNRQILNQFLTEGLVLSVAGGLIGVITAYLINLLLRLYTGLHPVITLPVVLAAIGVSLAVGIIFSGVPALKAARKLPIEALRGE
ncbi:ABC transporter permease [Candidatus Saccharibacteria bacterium]|nr:ABC transporter permease [Candidatus Saccharibacteria bacterium]